MKRQRRCAEPATSNLTTKGRNESVTRAEKVSLNGDRVSRLPAPFLISLFRMLSWEDNWNFQIAYEKTGIPIEPADVFGFMCPAIDLYVGVGWSSSPFVKVLNAAAKRARRDPKSIVHVYLQGIHGHDHHHLPRKFFAWFAAFSTISNLQIQCHKFFHHNFYWNYCVGRDPLFWTLGPLTDELSISPATLAVLCGRKKTYDVVTSIVFFASGDDVDDDVENWEPEEVSTVKELRLSNLEIHQVTNLFERLTDEIVAFVLCCAATMMRSHGTLQFPSHLVQDITVQHPSFKRTSPQTFEYVAPPPSDVEAPTPTTLLEACLHATSRADVRDKLIVILLSGL